MGNINCIHLRRKKKKNRLSKKKNITGAPFFTHSKDHESIMEEEEELTPTVEDRSIPMETDNNIVSLPQRSRHFEYHRVTNLTYAIPRGYDISEMEYLGGGSYGNVIKAKTRTREGEQEIVVAIKKMSQPFGSINNARRVFRELRLLQLMRHSNIIRAVDIYTPNTDFASFEDVYVVTEYAGHSLYEVMKNQRECGKILLQLEHIKFILYQLLRGLKYIHSASVMHRDLKPSNLSLTSSCDLTVLDFGLARTVENGTHGMSTYVMTRWYRSPEVIYWKIGNYDKQADVWSVGCIAAEMMMNRPLFPGESQNSQYDMITMLCGCPDNELLEKIEENHNAKMREVIERASLHRSRQNFYTYFRKYNPDLPDDAIDFLDKVLHLDPDRRLTVEQALQHPYLVEYYDDSDEPTVSEPFNLLDDNEERTIDEWKSNIWDEIQNFTGESFSPPFL